MHKKSIRLFISTLLLLLAVLLCGCGHSLSTTEADESSVIQDLNLEPSRFYVENANISNDVSNFSFKLSYIITDTETGKQYLYIYHVNGNGGGAAMVELGSTYNIANDIND